MKSTIIFIAILLFAACATAGQVSLTWDANNPAPEGYRVFEREEDQPYDYENPVWEGSSIIAEPLTIENGTKHYWVVRAFQGDLESDDSNEVGFSFSPDAPSGVAVKVYVDVQVNVNQ